MKSLVSTRFIAAAVAVLGALGASASYARSDVEFSVTVQSPGAYSRPAPYYVQPAPVYVQPAPVYVQPLPRYIHSVPQYVQPVQVYGPRRGGPYGDRDGDGVPNAYDRGHGNGYGHGRGHGHHYDRGWRDSDRDGVPNRYDRFPVNPYYR